MQHGNVVIGIDLGTTGTKCVIWSCEEKRVIGESSRTYPLLKPHPGWAEQNPDELFEAFVHCLRSAIRQAAVQPGRIVGIGISTAMHSLIAVDEAGKPLTNCITWADGRSGEQAERIRGVWNGLTIYRRTGTPIHPMSPLVKLLWLKERQPDTYEAAAKFVSIKEYVLYHLYGEWVVDHSIASATGLFNLEKMDWDDEVLELLNLPAHKLSRPVPVTYTLTGLNGAMAERLGILPDTRMVVGSSDGVLANLGVGAVAPGDIAVSVGTSGAIRTMSERPVTDEFGRTFCYALDGKRYAVGGATNNAGIVLQWLIEEMSRGQVTLEQVLEEAGEVGPGADGLLFLPYLNGERAPHWNADARAVFFGLSIRHQQAHVQSRAGRHCLRAVFGSQRARDAARGCSDPCVRRAGQVRTVAADAGGYFRMPRACAGKRGSFVHGRRACRAQKRKSDSGLGRSEAMGTARSFVRTEHGPSRKICEAVPYLRGREREAAGRFSPYYPLSDAGIGRLTLRAPALGIFSGTVFEILPDGGGNIFQLSDREIGALRFDGDGDDVERPFFFGGNVNRVNAVFQRGNDVRPDRIADHPCRVAVKFFSFKDAG